MWRSYWNRVWALQEIILARSVRVKCGQISICWTDFIAAMGVHRWVSIGMRSFESPTAPIVSSLRYGFIIVSIMALRSIWKASRGFSLWNIVQFTRRGPRLDAIEIRDHVSAFFGVISRHRSQRNSPRLCHFRQVPFRTGHPPSPRSIRSGGTSIGRYCLFPAFTSQSKLGNRLVAYR